MSCARNKNKSSPTIHEISLMYLNTDNNRNNIETLSTIVK